MKAMTRHSIYPMILAGVVFLLASCDKTIHEYPGPADTVAVVELNVDRAPLRYYKELFYDEDGEYSETVLEPDFAEGYTASGQLAMRMITELYRLPSSGARINKGELVSRRVVSVERLMEAPQDTLQFHVPEGNYRLLAWADYVPKEDLADWHFDTGQLDAVEENVDHHPRDNHHKNSAAGTFSFAVDAGEGGRMSVLHDGSRSGRADDGLVPVYLERTSGRLRLVATDLQTFLDGGNSLDDIKVKIVYSQYVSAGYNVDTQTPNRFVATRTMETVPSEPYGDGTVQLAYDYVLASDAKEDNVLVDIFLYKDDTEINHYQNITVPLMRNMETVVKGPFLTKKIGSGDIGIDDGFDDEIVVVIPDA